MEEENKIITQNSDDFISKNTKRYDIYSKVDTLSKETYQDTIQEIQKQSDIHFKDHQSSIFFFYNIVQASKFHFKDLELILDILIHFSTEIKAQTSEIELISISVNYSSSLYYLFDKHFFSISSIIEQSRSSDEIFITFLPEIIEYDKEYSEIREKIFLDKEISELLMKYYEFVKKHPKEHIFYRQLNYHPSPLHKAIRDDDIQTFQLMLSRNNYSINHRIEYSFYERLRIALDENMSLIQIAAFYGSYNIFKFLLMQVDIDLNDNLMNYAFAGQNIDIIHLCEQKKCEIDSSYHQPILTHSQDILDYCIYNYENEIIDDENDVIQNVLKDFEKNEDNSYEILNSGSLSSAIFSSNFEVIEQCLRKIVFISRNYEQLNRTDLMNNNLFLYNSNCDFELFKFLYSQRKQDIDIQTVPVYHYVVSKSVLNNANDSIKFMLNELKNKNLYFSVFKKGIKYNHVIANYILDLQLMEDHNDENSIFAFFEFMVDFDILIKAIKYYNEDIVVKIIMLYNEILYDSNQFIFINHILNYLSKKMILPLLDRILPLLPKTSYTDFAEGFREQSCFEIYNYINDYISKNDQ